MSSLIIRRLALEGAKKLSKRSFSNKGFSPKNLCGKLGIIGVPFGKGQRKKGKNELGLKVAPDAIRNTEFSNILASIGVDIFDLGNIKYKPECNVHHPNINNLDHFGPCAQAVSYSVTQILESCRSCLVLGGDHSIAVGSIYAHLEVAEPKNVAVVYVDAHTDINTDKTSPTGNIHGMTVALLANELQQYWSTTNLPGLEWFSPCLPLNNVAYIGVRSVDPGEAKILYDHHVSVFSIEDITKSGINKVLSRALQKIDPSGVKSIHLSFDIDGLDSLEAPCTSVPVRAGLTLREGIEIAETIHRTGRLSVVDLVEINPVIGTEFDKRITMDAAKHILLAMYGYSRRGNVRPETPE